MKTPNSTSELFTATILGFLIFGFAYFDIGVKNLPLENNSQLAQGGGWGWGPEDCPDYSEDNSIIKNGDFTNGVPENQGLPSYVDAYMVCNWFTYTSIATHFDYGLKYFDDDELSGSPSELTPTDFPSAIYPSISGVERFVGLIIADHFSSSWGQTHDYLIQNIEGEMESESDYQISFDYYVTENVSGYWPEELGNQKAGVLVALLNEEQFGFVVDSQVDSQAFTCTNGSPFVFCGESRDYFTPEEVVETLEANFETPIEILYVSPDNELESEQDQAFDHFSTMFTYPEGDFTHLLILGLGYNPEYEWGEDILKRKSIMILDNVSITPIDQVNFCSIQNTGSIAPVMITEDGLDQEVYTSGSINVGSTIFDNPQLDTDLYNDGVYVHRMGNVLDFDSLSSEWLGVDQILDGFNFLNMTIESATDFSGGHVWVEYSCLVECASDFDGNGVVNVNDLIFMMGDFGCLAEDCQGDLNADGITNILDLLEFMPTLGQQCLSDADDESYLEMSGLAPNGKPLDMDVSYQIKKPNIFGKYNFVINIENNGTRGVEDFKVKNILPYGFFTNTKYANDEYSFDSEENFISLANFKAGELRSFGLNVRFSDSVCQSLKASGQYSKIRGYNLCN